jgi:hypothetical protein
MVEPVTGSVIDERNIPGSLPVRVIVQTEKGRHAGLGEDCVRRLEKDVIAGDIVA